MKIEQFRQTRASELISAADRLDSVFSTSVNTTPIRLAAEALKIGHPPLKDKSVHADYWGYEIEDFKIPVETVRHLRPKSVDVKKVELILNMKLVADKNNWDNLNDPLVELNFNVIVKGAGATPHFFCFHIDKHDHATMQATEEPHPVYHLQFSSNPMDTEEFNYGEIMVLDTPRIIHHPIDFILGIGFLTSNFFPMAFDDMMSDGYFAGLYKRYQEKILQPYFHTLASTWTYDKHNIIWDKEHLCPSFL